MIILPGIAASGFRAAPSDGGVSIAKYSYAYTGADVDVFVPAGSTAMRVKLWGAGGHGGWYSGGVYGGGGGYVEAEFPVTPGQKITVQVPRGGLAPTFGVQTDRAYPDGSVGAFGDTGGGGGGGSARVWIAEAIAAVAAGGGGAAGWSGHGGNGGGLSGEGGAGRGVPGTQAGPGTVNGTGLVTYGGNDACAEGGDNWENAKNEILNWADRLCQRGGFGGPQGGGTGGDGGGGGGGWYGGAGGGGDGCAGGGGSSWWNPSALFHFTQTGLRNASVESTNADFPGGTVAKGAVSNQGTNGGDGFVVVDFLDGPTPVSENAQLFTLETQGPVPWSQILNFGKRYQSGPGAGGEWNKAGSRTSRKAADGDFYHEYTVTEKIGAGTLALGVAPAGTGLTSASGFPNNAGGGGRVQYFENGNGRVNDNYYGYGPAYGTGDVIGMRLRDEGGSAILRAYKNGVDLGPLLNLGSLAGEWEPHICHYGDGGAGKCIIDLLDLLYLPVGSSRW